MQLRSPGTKLPTQDLIGFLFDFAATLRRQAEGLLLDAVIASQHGQPREEEEAAEAEGKEQRPQTHADKACAQESNEDAREDHNVVGNRERELHEIKLAIADLRCSLAKTRLEVAEARIRAEEADCAARKAVEDSARRQERGLLGRWLRRG
jgi:hypothetical protein